MKRRGEMAVGAQCIGHCGAAPTARFIEMYWALEPSGARCDGTEKSMLEIVDACIEVEGVRAEPLAPIPEG